MSCCLRDAGLLHLADDIRHDDRGEESDDDDHDHDLDQRESAYLANLTAANHSGVHRLIEVVGKGTDHSK
jgi:hypothetical protein